MNGHSTLKSRHVEADPNGGFKPLEWSMGEIRAAIPQHLFVRKTGQALSYLARDLVVVAALCYLATWIDSPALSQHLRACGIQGNVLFAARYALWAS